MAEVTYLTKDDALSMAWEAIQQEPGNEANVLARLSDEFGITSDEFAKYDSTIVSNKEVKIVEDRLLRNAEKLKDISGFSQTTEMSDAEIIRTFDSLYEMEDRKKNIKRAPTEAEWYIAGIEADTRIKELEPFYRKQKKEEWDMLTKRQDRYTDPSRVMERDAPEFISETLGAIALGATGLMHEALFGWMDFLGENPEGDLVAHERGFGTSWNPLTGFGTWDVAEMRWNPEIEDWGFGPEVLAREKELEELYSIKRYHNDQMSRGGYEDLYEVNKEIIRLGSLIPEGVVDPRRIEGTQ